MASKMFSVIQSLFGIEPIHASLQSINYKSLQWEPILPPEIWTWGSITAVQTTHEAGLFQMSARLCDTLGRDDFITGLKQTRLLAINGLPEFFLDPDGTVSEDEQLQKDWKRLFPKSAQMEITDWVLHEGFCLVQLNYNDDLIPTPQVWHPGQCYWDKSQRTWQVYTQTGVLRLTGENAPGQGKWVLFKGWIDERPWYSGIIRAVGLLLMIRQMVLPEYLKYAKRATGLYILETDAMAAEVEDIQRTLDAMKQLNNGSYMHLLDGYKMDLLEFKGQAHQVFGNLLEYVDNALAILYLGAPDIVSTGKNGSRASSSVKDRPRQDRLESDVGMLAVGAKEILTAYYYWARNQPDPDAVPTAVWDATPPEDAVRQAEMALKRGAGAKAAADALEKLRDVPGFDVDEFCRLHHLPMESHGKASIVGRHERVLRAARPENAVPGLKKLIAAVKASTSPEDLRRRVIEAYQGLGPEKLALQMAKARVMAEKAGQQAVHDRLK